MLFIEVSSLNSSQIRDWYRDPRPDMLGPGCIKTDVLYWFRKCGGYLYHQVSRECQ